MTWTKRVVIQCDGAECEREAIVDQNSIRVAEKEIQEAGWEKEQTTHYCSDCVGEDD